MKKKWLKYSAHSNKYFEYGRVQLIFGIQNVKYKPLTNTLIIGVYYTKPMNHKLQGNV